MASSTLDTSTDSRTELNEKLDKFPNSGRIFKFPSTAGLEFYVLGCGENDPQAKREVAELMNEIAKGNKKRPDFLIILGDNFQENGVDSVQSEAFSEGFDKVYHAKELEEICGIPCFVVPGNHDHGFPVLYPLRVTGINNNYEKIRSQIERTYADAKGAPDPQKQAAFSQDTLNPEEMKKRNQTWNMPGRYYGLTDDTKDLFFIDSNTYVKEYIEYYLKGNKDFNKQPAWLEHVAKNPEKLKYLFLHHSLHTVGKRAFLSDAEEYLSKEDIQLLKDNNIIDRLDESYNEMLRRILEKQGLKFDLVFAAHDHNMYHYNNQNEIKSQENVQPSKQEAKSAQSPSKANEIYNELKTEASKPSEPETDKLKQDELKEPASKIAGSKKATLLKQVVTGAAGGGKGNAQKKLQNRFVFENDDKSTQCFIKRRGFVRTRLPAKPGEDTLIDYYSVADPELKSLYGIGGHHIQFANDDPVPRKEAPDEKGVKELRELFLAARSKYITDNPPHANSFPIPHVKRDWGFWLSYSYRVNDQVPLDAFFADDVKNHFDRFERNTFEASIHYLIYAFSKSPALAAVFFELPLFKEHKISLEQFSKKPIQDLQTLVLTGKMPEVLASVDLTPASSLKDKVTEVDAKTSEAKGSEALQTRAPTHASPPANSENDKKESETPASSYKDKLLSAAYNAAAGVVGLFWKSNSPKIPPRVSLTPESNVASGKIAGQASPMRSVTRPISIPSKNSPGRRVTIFSPSSPEWLNLETPRTSDAKHHTAPNGKASAFAFRATSIPKAGSLGTVFSPKPQEIARLASLEGSLARQPIESPSAHA